MAAFVKLDGNIYGTASSLLDGCVQSVVSNWKQYLSDIESLPSSLKDKCLYLMTKRGTLNDDNIAKVLHDKVRVLDLSDCDISDRGVLAIKKCPQLRKLDLNAAKESRTTITSQAVSQVAETCTYLQTVYLRRCLNLTDDAVVALSRSCPQLRYLNLGGCQQITDVALQALGQYSKYLRSVNLSHTKVTDQGMMSLASGQCAQSLNVLYVLCFTWTRYQVSVYRTIGPLEIHINGCEGVTDEGVEAVLQFCPQISIFIFHGCRNITEQSRLALEELTISRSQPMKQVTWTIY